MTTCRTTSNKHSNYVPTRITFQRVKTTFVLWLFCSL